MQSTALKTALTLVLGVTFTSVAASPRVASAHESGVAAAQAGAKGEASTLALGIALRRAGRETEALNALRRGLGVARGEMAGRIQWEIARTFMARREFESAMATCRAMPKDAAAGHVCAAEAHLLWRRGTEALVELDAAAKAKPSSEASYAAQVARGRVLELAARDSEAEAAYRDAIARADAQSDGHLLLGLLLRRTGRDAVGSLRTATLRDPHDPVAQLELGRTLPAGTEDSVAALERAVAERPSYPDALRGLAEGYLAMRRLPEARKTLDGLLKISPNDVGAHVLAGRLSLAEGRADDAIKEGELAAKLLPNDEQARLLVADAWAKKGEIDLAVEAYQAAFGLDHSDPTPLVNASRACLAAGRVTSAKAFGVRATTDFAGEATAWSALGDALAADSDRAGARAAYETAKKARGASVSTLDQKLSNLK